VKLHRLYIAAFILLLFSVKLEAQTISWTAFEHLNDSIRKAPKPILVFIQAEWCKFCEMQDKNTFTNLEVVKKLSRDFYTLKLNGESKSPIKFLNRTYTFKSSGSQTGNHQLAEFLGKKGGELVYPTTVLLTSKLNVSAIETGFINADDLLKLLSQF
jgi:thioredoxin-related protein